MKRIKQLFKYGWLHAGKISGIENKGPFFRIKIFFDIVSCFCKYRMWSNQYLQENFWLLSQDERKELGRKYKLEGKIRDEWQRDFRQNRKFLYKYTSRKYELSRLREKRNKAYIKRYNMGSGCMIEYNVELSRQHYLPGKVSIGKNVLLAKNVFIDYSGVVEIKDNVRITNNVIIESHHHPFHSDYRENRKIVTSSNIIIEEDAVIGSKSIILSSCHYIGKHARVAAGAVVTKDVPDYATVAGVPAKIIKMNVPDAD